MRKVTLIVLAVVFIAVTLLFGEAALMGITDIFGGEYYPLFNLFVMAWLAGTVIKCPQAWKIHLVIFIALAVTGFFVPRNVVTTGAGVYPLIHSTPLIAFLVFTGVRHFWKKAAA